MFENHMCNFFLKNDVKENFFKYVSILNNSRKDIVKNIRSYSC